MAALVTGCQHRISRQGNKFGVLLLEDFSGKFEITLFSDQYVRFASYFGVGNCLFIQGRFEMRPYRNEWQFRVSDICLLETVKRSLTRQLQIHIHPRLFKEEHLRFLESNVKRNPGKARLRFVFNDKRERTSVSLSTLDKGFEMNDEMADFLADNPEFEVQVDSA